MTTLGMPEVPPRPGRSAAGSRAISVDTGGPAAAIAEGRRAGYRRRHQRALTALADVHTVSPASVEAALHPAQQGTVFSAPVTANPWLFVGLHPGRPFNTGQLGARLRRLGIGPQAARRGAMIHLAATLPAAVLARTLDITPLTAVRWVKAAGGDWGSYAAELLHSGDRGV